MNKDSAHLIYTASNDLHDQPSKHLLKGGCRIAIESKESFFSSLVLYIANGIYFYLSLVTHDLMPTLVQQLRVSKNCKCQQRLAGI